MLDGATYGKSNGTVSHQCTCWVTLGGRGDRREAEGQYRTGDATRSLSPAWTWFSAPTGSPLDPLPRYLGDLVPAIRVDP
jgi:hypothetical protein